MNFSIGFPVFRGKEIDGVLSVRIHADQVAAMDFIAVPVWTQRGLVMYRVPFVIDLVMRTVEIRHIGCQVSGGQMMQIGRNLTVCFSGFLLGKKWLLNDQVPLFTEVSRELLRGCLWVSRAGLFLGADSVIDIAV